MSDPISMPSAVRIVNANTQRVTGTLRATGFVDGQSVLTDGRVVSYHLDGILFYLAPTYVRFDLKSFGDRKFLLGCNAESFWVYEKETGEYQCNAHGEDDEFSDAIPIAPNQLVDALGLNPIPTGGAGDNRVQRIVDDYQQILFLERDDSGAIVLQKEYWLDRRAPGLIRRVVFRDPYGAVEMDSSLDDYRALGHEGPMLPHSISADWPAKKASMRFRVSKWRFVETVGPQSIQFKAPPACRNP